MLVKKVLFAAAAVVLLASTVRADDDLLDGFDTTSITTAQAELVTPGLDGLDVDELQTQAGDEQGDEAIEACFRRFGYGYRHFGYGYGYGFRSWNCYRPCYPVRHYYGFHCYRPIVRVYRPVYYHWGCY